MSAPPPPHTARFKASERKSVVVGLVVQLHLTLCDPMDCSPPDSSSHGISQARMLECVVISFSRGSSQPRDPTRISCTGRQTLSRQAQKRKIGNSSLTKSTFAPSSLWQVPGPSLNEWSSSIQVEEMPPLDWLECLYKSIDRKELIFLSKVQRHSFNQKGIFSVKNNHFIDLSDSGL